MQRIAVIGGGGAWGAYHVGTLSALNKKYDRVIGCSTGALMALLVAVGKYEKLQEAYVEVEQDSIFSYNPFKKNGNLNFWKCAWRVITGKPTLGETKNLRKLIDEYITEEDYKKALELDIEVCVTVYNKTRHTVEYKSNQNHSYSKFKEYVWASACAFPVSSIVEIDNCQYEDGGTLEVVPLNYAYRKAIISDEEYEIDCFVHRTHSELMVKQGTWVNNIVDNLSSFITSQRMDIERNDILCTSAENVNFYYLANKLSNNSLIFDKNKMKEWMIQGYSRALPGVEVGS